MAFHGFSEKLSEINQRVQYLLRFFGCEPPHLPAWLSAFPPGAVAATGRDSRRRRARTGPPGDGTDGPMGRGEAMEI